MQALARSAAAALRRSSTSASSSATAGTRRSMSSGVSLEEEKKQMDLWRVITIVGKKGKEEAKASPGAATLPVFLSFFLFVLSLAPPFRVFFSFPRGLLESLRDALRDGEEKRSRRMRHHLENQRSEMIIVVSLAQSLFFLLRPRPPEKKKLQPAIPACLAFTFYTISNEEHHTGGKPERTYTNVRSKPFPWGEDALFTKKGGHH